MADEEADDIADDGDATAAAATPEARLAALEREVARLTRLQQHGRAQQMSLHGALVGLHETLRRQVDVDLPEPLKPVSRLDNARTDILFLAFAGLNLGIGIPPFEFRRSLSQHGAPGLFIKDFHQSWYQQGLLGLTSDLAETREYLARRVAEEGGRTVVTLGASTGGYAAILFGCWLGARRVLAFSPQTTVTRRVAARFAQLDTPPDFLRRGDPMPDLKDVVAEAGGRTEIVIYYGAEHRYDAQQARRLSGLPNVTLRPVDGVDSHSMPAELRRRGELDSVLAEVLRADA